MSPQPSAPSAGLHADACAVLSGWHPGEPDQAMLRDRMLARLAQAPDAMERDSFPAHLTAGTLVLSAGLDHVLLNLHGKAGIWVHFGGHCEPDDATLAGVAAREAAEESGLTGLELTPEPVHLDAHDVDFCSARGTVTHLDVRYAARARPGATPQVSEESTDVRWWSLAGLPPLEDEMLVLIRRSVEALG